MRERTTWDRKKIAARRMHADDPRAMNQDHHSQQPSADEYQTGGPSEFAEDVHPSAGTWKAEDGPGGETARNEIGMPQFRPDTFKTANLDPETVLKKSNLAVKIARHMLPKGASDAEVEDQALALMDIPDTALIETANRMAGVTAKKKADDGEDEDEEVEAGKKASKKSTDDEDEDDEEVEAGKKASRRRSAKKSTDDEDEDDEEVEASKKASKKSTDDEDEDDEEAMASKKAKKKAEDDEDEDEDEDEESGKPEKGKVPPQFQKKEGKKSTDDEDEDDEEVEASKKARAKKAACEACMDQAYACAMAGDRAGFDDAMMAYKRKAEGEPEPAMANGDEPVMGDDDLLDEMLAGDDEPPPAMAVDEDIQLGGPSMDVGEVALDEGDEVLATLFNESTEVQQARQALASQKTRTVGTKPKQGVAKIGSGHAKEASTKKNEVQELSNLWASAPDVSKSF